MATTSQKLAVLLATVGALVLGGPVAVASPPPRLDRAMQWYRWHPSARNLQGRTMEVGSTAVLGVVSMRELAPLRSRYGFRVVRAFPQLHAAEVSVSRLLSVGAAGDRRIRYLSPLGPRRRLMAMPNDPLVWTVDPLTQFPYEWQFASSHATARSTCLRSPSVVVGMIDTGVADADLAARSISADRVAEGETNAR
jgi:hypothetical protein